MPRSITTMLILSCLFAMVMSGLVLDVATDLFDRSILTDTLAQAAADEGRKIGFVGTSRIMRGIDPAALEHELGQAGCPASVFVFAMPGLSRQEERFLQRHLRADRDLGNEFDHIFVDRTVMAANRRDSLLHENLSALLWEHWLTSHLREGPSSRLVLDFYYFLRLALHDAIALRRVTLLAESWVWNQRPIYQGHIPFLPDEYPQPLPDDCPACGFDAAQTVSRGPGGGELYSLLRRSWQRRSDEWATVGPNSFVLMPVRDLDEGAAPGFSSVAQNTTVLNMNHPGVHTRLSSHVNWHDAGHLSNLGAARFAEILAPQVCALLNSGQFYALR